MLQQLKNAVDSREQHFKNLNHYAHNGEPAASMERKWWECSKAEYWDALEALPPLRMGPNYFVFLEALTGDIHSVYFKINERYFCADLDISDRAEIRKAGKRIGMSL